MSSQQAAFPAAESLKDSVLKQRSCWCAATNLTCAFDKTEEHTPKITLLVFMRHWIVDKDYEFFIEVRFLDMAFLS